MAASAESATLALLVAILAWTAGALPSPDEVSFGSPRGSLRDPTTPFEWAAVGDSWSSGVAYSASTVYSNTDFEYCYRSTESWGAQMASDNTWTLENQTFHFSACGGTLMNDISRQMTKSGNASLVLGTFGGNNAFFGDIARACIYQPRGTDWGLAYDKDPDGTGMCKKNLAKSLAYMNGSLAKDFTKAIVDVFAAAKQQTRPLDTEFNLYVSSYAEFFNADTDNCTDWTFAPYGWLSNGKPKLVKELRSVMNTMLVKFNDIQEGIATPYAAPSGFHVRYVSISDAFEGHRFCEAGHPLNDQFYSADVWIWNLQWFNGNEGPGGSNVVATADQTTDDGGDGGTVWFMQAPPGLADGSYPVAIMSLDTDNLTTADLDVINQSQSGFGWTARPFHPKKVGNGAMAAAYIARFQADGVRGVAPAKSAVGGVHCRDTSQEDDDGFCVCSQNGVTTTFTQPGGPGNSCPTASLSLGPGTAPFSAPATAAAAAPTTSAASGMKLVCNPWYPNNEDTDGRCTCTQDSLTTTFTPPGGLGNRCPTALP